MMMSNFSRNSNFQRGGALRRSQHNHFVENSGQWVANIYVNGLAANQMEVFVDRGDVVVRSKECIQKNRYYDRKLAGIYRKLFQIDYKKGTGDLDQFR